MLVKALTAKRRGPYRRALRKASIRAFQRRLRVERLEDRHLLTTVTLSPISDATLFEDPNGAFANGAGDGIFSGVTANQNQNLLRRALLKFDIGSAVPAGATINTVSLRLTVTMTPNPVVSTPMSLHEVLADWGEGTTNAGGQEGTGAPSTANSATWRHRFFSGSLWTTLGGDFDSAASATTSVANFGNYEWSGSGLVADVQQWLNTPSTQFGWLLKASNETSSKNAKRFGSRENPNSSVRPLLTVDFTAPSNKSPTLDAIANPPAILEDANSQIVGLTGITAGQGETQVLTVTAVSNNPGLIPNPTVTYVSPNSTGSLAYAPVTNQSGTATITVTVKDNGGTDNGGVDTIVRSFTVTVNPVNDAPTLDAIANSSAILEDAGEQTVNLTGISAGPSEIQTLAVTAASSNPGLIPNPTVTYVSPNLTGSLAYTPVANQSGTATVTVTVRDNGGTANGGADTFTRTFTVTVNPVNDAPTLDAIANPAAILEDASSQSVNLAGITAGPNETQSLTVTAVSSNPGLIPNPTVLYASPNSTGSLAYTPVANQSGTATVTVIVTDDGGTANGGVNTISRVFTVTVSPVNDAPTLDSIANPATLPVSAGAQNLNLSGISAGPNESQTLTVTAVSSNPGLIPNPLTSYTNSNVTGSLSYTPVANQTGTATITVTVMDDGGTENGGVNVIARTFTITVAPVNQAPTLDAIPAQLAIDEDAGNQTISLTGISAGTGESQVLTVTATSSNPSLIPTPTVSYASPATTGTLTYAPVANESGTAVLIVTVMDNGGTALGGVDTITRTVTVTVNAVNDAPTLAAIPNPAPILEDAAAQTINLTGISAGPKESQPLSVATVSSNPGLIPIPTVSYASPGATGSLTYSPVTDQSGTAIITVTVEDGGLDGNLTTKADNATTSQQFTVTVNAVNDLPTLNPLPDLDINENDTEKTVSLTGISAGGGESQPLRITATSSNATVLPTPTVIYASADPTGSLKFTPAANETGAATITVIVEDGGLDGNLATTLDNGRVERSFSVRVGISNLKPTLDPIPNRAIDEDAPEQLINLAGISAGAGEIQNLRITASSSATGLIPNPTVTYLSPQSTGELRFTPLSNQNGSAEITVTVEDDGPDGNFATSSDNAKLVRSFTVTVNPVNDPPIAADDSFNVNQETLTILNLLGNDTDIDSSFDTGSFQFSSGPTNGTIAVNAGGQVEYLPKLNFFGQDSFSYRVADSQGAFTNLANVSLAVNARPIAVNDLSYLNAGAPTNVDVLANDSDPDGAQQDLQIVIVSVLNPSIGQVEVTTGKLLRFTAGPSFAGSVQLDYRLRDALGAESPTASVMLGVYNQNPILPEDVNGSGQITPFDVLLVINTINVEGGRRIPPGNHLAPFFDVSADGFVSPLDALIIINFLNRQVGGEGELSQSNAAVPPISLSNSISNDLIDWELERDPDLFEVDTADSRSIGEQDSSGYFIPYAYPIPDSLLKSISETPIPDAIDEIFSSVEDWLPNSLDDNL